MHAPSVPAKCPSPRIQTRQTKSTPPAEGVLGDQRGMQKHDVPYQVMNLERGDRRLGIIDPARLAYMTTLRRVMLIVLHGPVLGGAREHERLIRRA
jgi:hypothetical protein